METVTPINSGEAKEAQQIQQQTSAQAIEVAKLVMELIEKWLEQLKKSQKDGEEIEQETRDDSPSNHQSSSQKPDPLFKKKTPQNNQYPSDKDELEITINGQKKLGGETNKLTWSDYGQLQAVFDQALGNSHPAFANTKVAQITHKDGKTQRQTLLETDDQGQVLTNVAKQLQIPKTISGFDAINRAVSQLPNGELKTYLDTLNQQMVQQFQQQEKVLQEAQIQNRQLREQLELSQAVFLTSQTMNLEYAKMLQQYQQAQQYRNPKDVKGWPNLIKHPVKSVQQWWTEKQRQWSEKVGNIKAATTVRDFVKYTKQERFSGTQSATKSPASNQRALTNLNKQQQQKAGSQYSTHKKTQQSRGR